MGYKELIEALREEGEKKVKEIWREAEAGAEKIMKETESKIDELKREYERRFSLEAEKKRTSMLSEAAKEASRMRLDAEEYLSKRLFKVALEMLQSLRKEDYREVFNSLLREIPNSEWVTVRVNPEDVVLAQSLLPGAKVISDDSIIGGFVIFNSDGNIITNTFEKRLERLWPEILPEILKTIREMYESPDR